MNTAIIVQARMGSTRLPGKVLLPVLGRPMFAFQIERLRRVTRADGIVVATTVEARDDAIEAFCASEHLRCVRGPEQDVLARYHLAASACGAQTVLRVTADCPLIDPALIDQAIARFRDPAGPCDYLSNMLEPSYPYGMAVEVMSAEVLHRAHAEAKHPDEREHVTPFIYWRPERFRLRSLRREQDLSQHRWTVDTPQDFELVSRILAELYPVQPEFGIDEVLAVLEKHPDWPLINSDVNQHQVAKPREER